MAAPAHTPHTSVLRRIAERAMVERGLRPAFSAGALAELKALEARGAAPAGAGGAIRDLTAHALVVDRQRQLARPRPAHGRRAGRRGRGRPSASPSPTSMRWSRTDRPSTSTRGTTPPRSTRPPRSSRCCPSGCPPISRRSIPARIGWPWSSRWTSMPAALVTRSDVYRARVRNHAKLAYNSVAAWLEGTGPDAGAAGGRGRARREPPAAGPGGAAAAAAAPRARRAAASRPSAPGRSSTATICSGLDTERKNRATELIEDFMIAANGETARFLDAQRVPVAPPGRAHAEALGPHRRARRASTAPPCRTCRTRWRSTRFLAAARARRSGALPRPLAGGGQAARRRRVRGRAPGRPGAGAFRPGGEGLHALDRARIAAIPTWSRSAC